MKKELKGKSEKCGVWEKVIIVFLLMVLLAEGIYTITGTSNYYDEAALIAGGYTHLRLQDYSIEIASTPLIQHIYSIPLLFINPKVPLNHSSFENREAAVFGRQFLFFSGNNADQLIFWARIPVLLLSMILGFFVYKWAKEMYGGKAGMFALLLYVTNPVILGSSTKVTLNVGVTLFMFLCVYYFMKFVYIPSKRNLLIAGVMFGAAQASKYSAMLLVPILFILYLVAVRYKKGLDTAFKIPFAASIKKGPVKNYYKVLVVLLFIGLIGTCVIFASYGFKFSKLDLNPREAETITARLGGEGLLPSIVGFMQDIPLPLTHYITGLGYQFFYSSQGNEARYFFMGQSSTESWWQYFIVGFFARNTISMLILFLGSLFMFFKLRHKDMLKEWFLIIPPAFIIFYFSFISNLNWGIQYILPAFPFILVFSSKIVNLKFEKKGYIVLVLIGGLLFWNIVSFASAMPYNDQYVNEAFGGISNSHNVLFHFDCGAYLPELAKYISENDIETVKWVYTGTADPDYYGVKYDNLYNPYGLSYWVKEEFDYDKTCSPKEGVYAIPRRVLVNFQEDPNCFSWLRDIKEDARVGQCFFIYNIGPDQLSHQE